MIVGLAHPDRGRVLLDDEEITALPMYLRARKGINYLPQEPSVFRKLTVAENVLAVLENMPYTKARAARDRWSGCSRTSASPTSPTHKAHSLSGGERRRVEICRALATSPELRAARRAVRRHRPDRGDGDPEARRDPQGAGTSGS